MTPSTTSRNAEWRAQTDTKIGTGELVELGPSLWNELAALLNERVEPGEREQRLRALHNAAATDVVGRPGFVGTLQVPLYSWLN